MKGNYTLRASAAKNHTLNKAGGRLKLGEGARSVIRQDFRENEAGAKEVEDPPRTQAALAEPEPRH